MTNFRTRVLGLGLCATLASGMIISPVANAQSTDSSVSASDAATTNSQPTNGSSFEQCLKSPLLVVLGLAGATGIIGSLVAPMITPITNSLNAQASQASKDLLGQLGVTDSRPEWLRQIDSDLRGVFGAGYQQQLAIPAGILAGALALSFINDQCGGSLTSSGLFNSGSSTSGSSNGGSSDTTNPANPFEVVEPAKGITITNTSYEADGVHVTFSDGTSIVIPNGKDGADGTNGADGKDGADGTNGVSIYITDTTTTDTSTIVHFSDGTSIEILNGKDGVDGAPGEDGTSVTITSVVNGDNTTLISFSDGTSVTVPWGVNGKDGKDGANGTNGTSVTITGTTTTDTSTIVHFSDGTSIEVFNGADGAPGAPGKDGTSVTITSIANGTDSTVISFSDGNVVTIPHGQNGTNGESLTVTNTALDDDGNTVITFSDGKTATVQKGANGICDCYQPAPETCDAPIDLPTGNETYYLYDAATGLYVNSASGDTTANLDTSAFDPAGKQLRSFVGGPADAPVLFLGLFDSTVAQPEINDFGSLINAYALSAPATWLADSTDKVADAQSTADDLNNLGSYAVVVDGAVIGLALAPSPSDSFSAEPTNLDGVGAYLLTLDGGCTFTAGHGGLKFARELKIRQ